MGDSVYLKIIFNSSEVHPVYGEPLIAFIYDYKTKETEYFNFKHGDFPFTCSFEEFLKNIEFKNVYVIDKKRYLYFLKNCNIFDINSILFVNDNSTITPVELHSISHINLKSIREYNYVIPFTKHLAAFEEEIFLIQNFPKIKYDQYSFNFFNNFLSEILYEIEKNGIRIDSEIFSKYFPLTDMSGFVYSQYNIYNPSGRPSNHFNNVNYAALNKDNGCRKSFISRYDDGYYLVIDFVGFHPYIISKLISYNIPEEETIYEHLAKFYFNKQEISDTDIANSKKLTMYNLYGQIKDEFLHIDFFKKIEELKNSYWECFLKRGYIKTPLYKRRITNKHISNPNKNKLFSYIIQAAETEYSINSLDRCNKFVTDKDITPILYVYDSVVFDVSSSVEKNHIDDLLNIFNTKGFKVKTYVGKNYQDLDHIM